VTSSSYRSSESSDSEEKEESHLKPKVPSVHNNSQLEVGDESDQETESFMFGGAVKAPKASYTSVKAGQMEADTSLFDPEKNSEYKSLLLERYPDDIPARTEFLLCKFHGLDTYPRDTNFSEKYSFNSLKWFAIPHVPVSNSEMLSIESFITLVAGNEMRAKLEATALKFVIAADCWNAYAASDAMVLVPGDGALVTCKQLGILMGSDCSAHMTCDQYLRIGSTKVSQGKVPRPGGQAFVFCPQHLRGAGLKDQQRCIRIFPYLLIFMRDFLRSLKGAHLPDNLIRLRKEFSVRHELLLAALVSAYHIRNWMAVRDDKPRPHWKKTPPKSMSKTDTQSQGDKSRSISEILEKENKTAIASGQLVKPSPHSVTNRHGGSTKSQLGATPQGGKPKATANPSPVVMTQLDSKPKAKPTGDSRTPPQHIDLVVPGHKKAMVSNALDDIAKTNEVTKRSLYLELRAQFESEAYLAGQAEKEAKRLKKLTNSDDKDSKSRSSRKRNRKEGKERLGTHHSKRSKSSGKPGANNTVDMEADPFDGMNEHGTNLN